MSKQASNVKDILTEMKKLAEICVNIAFASLMYDDEFMAEQVLLIEKKIDHLYNILIEHLSLSIKSASMAEELRIYYSIGEANNIISDSAADMASLVLRGIKIEDEIKQIQQHMEEIVDLVVLDGNSPLIGKSEESSNIHTRLGIDIVGIITKDKEFKINVDEVLRPGDAIIFRGALENVNEFFGLCRGLTPTIQEARESIIDAHEEKSEQPKPKKHQEILVTMKQTADLLVDFAYLYALEDIPKIKALIITNEEKIDNLQYELIDEILTLFKADKINRDTLIAYLRMADSFEEIADASIKIAFGVSMKHKHYDLLEEIQEESSEIMDYITLNKESEYIGMTIFEAEQTGDIFQILALRRKGNFIFNPDEELVLQKGDGIVVREYS